MTQRWALSLVMIAIAGTPGYVHAQEYGSEEILEYSLSGLKESVRRIQTKNQWLKREIESLESKIQGFEEDAGQLKVEKRTLLEQAAQGRSYAEERLKEAALQKKSFERLQSERRYLLEEHESLRQQISKKEAALAKGSDAIAKIQEENMTFRAKLHSYEKTIAGEQGIPEYQHLKTAIVEEEERILRIQMKLKELNANHLKPLQGMDALKEENAAWKNELEGRRQEWEQLVAQEKDVQEQLLQLDEKLSVELARFDEDIEKLSEKKQELERVLTKADIKLKEQGIKLEALAELESPEILQRNLRLIRKENGALKDKYVSLQEEMERLREKQGDI